MKPILVGIAGGTGSGKTTVARKIMENLPIGDAICIVHDSYYRDITCFDAKSAAEINFDHPDSLDTSLLVDHLIRLKRGEEIERPVYDYTTYRRLPTKETVCPKSVIILEGILIFAERELRNLMDIKVFVDTDADERLLRRLKRDVLERRRSLESVMSQYMKTVKPMHLEFVEPSKRWADVIVPKGGENEVAIAMIASRIRSMVEGTSGYAQPIRITN